MTFESFGGVLSVPDFYIHRNPNHVIPTNESLKILEMCTVLTQRRVRTSDFFTDITNLTSKFKNY